MIYVYKDYCTIGFHIQRFTFWFCLEDRSLICFTAAEISFWQKFRQWLHRNSWWRHHMEPFPRYWPFVRGIQRPLVNFPYKGQWRGASMFSLICALNERLSKQSWGWWFETPSRSLWHHCNAVILSTSGVTRDNKFLNHISISVSSW